MSPRQGRLASVRPVSFRSEARRPCKKTRWQNLPADDQYYKEQCTAPLSTQGFHQVGISEDGRGCPISLVAAYTQDTLRCPPGRPVQDSTGCRGPPLKPTSNG